MKSTVTFIFIASCFLTGCSSNKTYYVDYDQYPTLPISGTSKFLRAIAEKRPKLREKGIFENYGGPGNQGGRPESDMDKLFYEHDRAYLEKTTLKELRESDIKLIEELEALDESKLSTKEIEYRDLAINYFRKPSSKWLGKPGDVVLGLRRKQWAFPMSEYPGPGHNPNVVKTTVEYEEEE